MCEIDNLNKGFTREKNCLREIYFSDSYFSAKQWADFAFQTQLVYQNAKKKEGSFNKIMVLEIGKGSGVVSSVLKNIGFQIETMDINEKLFPDYVQNICDIETGFSNHKWDIIICCEVLEHIPFDSFDKCLSNIYQLLKENGILILTLPNNKTLIPFTIQIGPIHFSRVIKTRLPNKEIPSMHFWEISSSPQTDETIVEQIIEKYFLINEHGYVPSNNYHIYYVCSRK